MKISYNWLKNYLHVNIAPGKMSELLTNCGLEVEGMEEIQSVKGGGAHVVVGKVIEVTKHPNADRLFLTKVDVGEKELLSIVCGAPNVAGGQKVAVARIGARLFLGEQELVIKKSKIRGELSEGMICAEDELGLGDGHDGILVLDENAEPGTPVSDYFNSSSDFVFEIGLTPNRTDAMSHYGVARDLYAVFRNFRDEEINQLDIKLKLPEIDDFKADNITNPIKIEIHDTDACFRYAGVNIRNVKVEESPKWLKEYLMAIGIRPINNLVDISNFVLMETGQPLHFFDADEISGSKILVKKLPSGTSFTSLDEVDRTLHENDLMICNEKEAMCIAGVFGGIKSGVSSKTTNVFIESAWFDPVHIRKTAKRHDLHTDASFRFERGVDPNMVIYALKRAALLIKEIAGGAIASEVTDVYPVKALANDVKISYNQIDNLIGKSITAKTLKEILKDLEFEILEESSSALTLRVPSYRVDVTRPADVVEEIIRIYGYNSIPLTNKLLSSVNYSDKPDKEKLQKKIAELLTDNGFSEIMCNSLTNADYAENFPFLQERKTVKISNPVSKELDAMRQTLLLGGLETISRNINHKTFDLKLFEFGFVYESAEEVVDGEAPLFNEQKHCALFISGKKEMENWRTAGEEVDFFYLKNQVLNIILKAGLNPDNFTETSLMDDPMLDMTLIFSYKNMEVMKMGKVKQNILKYFDIPQEVFYTDIQWNILFDVVADHQFNYKRIPKYPEVRRDLALLLDKKVEFSSIKTLAMNSGIKLLQRINLFDVYEGDRIGKGKKSYAVSFFLRSDEKTLTEKEIDKSMNKLVQLLKKQLGADLRDG